MKVWVVTVDDHSQEGLEGAFDVFVGVAGSALGALALIDDGKTYKQPRRFDLDLDTGAVVESTEWDAGEYRGGVWVVTGKRWSEGQTFHIKELDIEGS